MNLTILTASGRILGYNLKHALLPVADRGRRIQTLRAFRRAGLGSLLAADCWLQAAGYWLLADGFWLLVAGKILFLGVLRGLLGGLWVSSGGSWGSLGGP